MTAPERRRAASPLRRREFRLYFIGNLTSNIGSWLNNVAVAVFMRDLTHSSFWVGVAAFGSFLPTILFALPAGVLADRVDRVKLLWRSQVLMGTAAIVLTILSATHHANRYSVTAVAFVLGLGIAIGIPAMQALVPNMVPSDELADAIGFNALTFNIARAVGPLVAAALLVTLGASWAFGINAASFFILVVMLRMIGTTPFPRTSDRPPGPIREGVLYAWRHLRTRAMLLSIVAIGVALDPIITLSPALAQRYGLKTGSAGWIVAAWGAGAVLMIVVAMPTIRVVTDRGLGWIGLVVLAGGMVALGGATNMSEAIPAAILAGLGYITATMAFTTTIQLHVPESMRGRVMAIWTLAFLGPRALAAVIEGAVADHIGARTTTVAFGLVALVAAVFLRRVETAPGAEPISPPA